MKTGTHFHRALTLLLALTGLFTSVAFGEPAREAMDKGLAHYRKGEFAKAEELFRAASEDAREAKLDPAVAIYNQANTLMNLSRPDEAAKLYAESIRTADIALQQRAYFNQGNAMMVLGRSEASQGNYTAMEKQLEQAIQLYTASMLLDPADRDAKVNYERALATKQGFLDAIAAAEALLVRANALTDQYEYVAVRDLLNQQLPQLQVAMALRPEIGKKFQTMIENVNKVLTILEEAPTEGNLVPVPETPSAATTL